MVLFEGLFKRFWELLGDLGVPLGVFGRVFVALGAAWDPKVDLGTTWQANADLQGARDTPFCHQGLPKGPPEAPIVIKRAPKGIQRDPKVEGI